MIDRRKWIGKAAGNRPAGSMGAVSRGGVLASKRECVERVGLSRAVSDGRTR